MHIYCHFKNIILNICVFLKEDSMILKKYIHFHLNFSCLFQGAFNALTVADIVPSVLPSSSAGFNREGESRQCLSLQTPNF